jgi:hypothetical protein
VTTLDAGTRAPASFINGERFDGDWRDIEQLAVAIEEAAAGAAPVVSR